MREKILAAALELFQRYSFIKTSVADIARGAGIGKGSVYLWFKSKDEILYALLQGESDRVHERLDPMFMDPSVELSEKVDRLVEIFLDQHFYVRDLMFAGFEGVEAKSLKDIYAKFDPFTEHLRVFILKILEIHGLKITEELSEAVKEFILFLSGRFIVHTLLSSDWSNRDTIRAILPKSARFLMNALIR